MPVVASRPSEVKDLTRIAEIDFFPIFGRFLVFSFQCKNFQDFQNTSLLFKLSVFLKFEVKMLRFLINHMNEHVIVNLILEKFIFFF